MIVNYMKKYADRNNIWDRSQLGTWSGVLGTVDQLIIDNVIIDEVRNQQRNLAVAFFDYQKAYDMEDTTGLQECTCEWEYLRK